jgi:hypothetical protein
MSEFDNLAVDFGCESTGAPLTKPAEFGFLLVEEEERSFVAHIYKRDDCFVP